jgi:twinkle protein
MAGQCVEKIPHEACGSRDGLQTFEENGEYNGYCYSCSTYVPNPYGDVSPADRPKPKARSEAEIAAEVAWITANLGTMDLSTRGLKQEYLEHYGVKVGMDQVFGKEPSEVYFPVRDANGKLLAYKTRLLKEKKMWHVGPGKEGVMFGWKEALATGGKMLFITEGEYDAIALFQVLKESAKGTKYEDYDPAVVSLRKGATGVKKELAAQAQEIRANFKEVVLVFDQDEHGQEAVHAAMAILPMARKCGDLPAKDANECLLEGRSKALKAAVMFKHETPANTRLVDLTSFVEAGRSPPEMGMSWPWEGLTKLTRGIRYGETIYIGAGVKMGKSELVNSLATHFILEHNVPVFMAKPEESNLKTMKLLLGKVAGKVFHDPEIEWDDEMFRAYDAAAKRIRPGMVYGLDMYQTLDYQRLRQEIVLARSRGVRAVFVDPITNLTNGISAADANTKLQEIAQDLAALAKDEQMVIFLFCHLKAPDSGEPHERGGKVYSSQFAGSRAMMRSCNLMLGLEGNKDPDLDMYERNTRRLIILEDREFGVTGSVKLYWDHNTGLFNEVKGI